MIAPRSMPRTAPRRPHLAAMARPSYVQLSGYAQAANCTLALLEGRSHLVVPVVAMVAGSIVRGMNSLGPEYVPADVLANFPESFNGRPVVPIHPYDGTGSANDPSTQNKYRYGQVFNARTDEIDGNLKLDAWLDIERATALGGEPASVVADCQAGKLVEVSLGAWIVMAAEEGELDDGRKYEYIWQYITSYDHLAMGLAGLEGACSCATGCGGPRLYTASGAPVPPPLALAEPTVDPISELSLAALALAKARRPTFSGIETTTWSAPSWHEWVTALHTGNESPKSITDATDGLKASIARHTLLGDPNAVTLRDLTMFPVVNPHSGKLNERALRAVLGGRGSAADIPDTAKTSAQSMARVLLKSEFDIEIAETSASTDSESDTSDPKESANMAVPQTSEPEAAGAIVAPAVTPTTAAATRDRSPKLFARMLAGITSLAASFRANGGSTDGVSDSKLRANLYNALRASEPAFGWGSYYWSSSDAIIDVFTAESTVVYVTCPYDDVIYWRQTYTVDAAGNVKLSGDREMVSPDWSWKPIPATPIADVVDALDLDADTTVVVVTASAASASASTTPASTLTAASACGCHSAIATPTLNSSDPATGDPTAAPTTETISTGGPSPMTPTPVVKTLVARLIANSAGVFTAEQIPTLESLPEAALTTLCEKHAPIAAEAPTSATVPAAATEVAAPTPAANTAAVAPAAAEPESFDALLARSPIEFQAFYAQGKAAMDARKVSLLAAINGKSKATAAMLTATPTISIEQLEAVATELGCLTAPALNLTPIPSYMGVGFAVPPLPTASTYQVAKPYDVALKALGAKPLTPPRPGDATAN